MPQFVEQFLNNYGLIASAIFIIVIIGGSLVLWAASHRLAQEGSPVSVLWGMLQYTKQKVIEKNNPKTIVIDDVPMADGEAKSSSHTEVPRIVYPHGLAEVFVSRRTAFDQSINGKWDTYLNHVVANSSELDIVGINLDGIFGFDKMPDRTNPETEDLMLYGRVVSLLNRIKLGTTVRIIVPTTDSEYLLLRQRTEDTDDAGARWKMRLSLNMRLFNHIKEKYIAVSDASKLNVCRFDNILYYFMIRSDNLMFVAPYLAFTPGDECPGFVLCDEPGGNNLFSKFKNDFDKIFRAAQSQKLTDPD
jgi:hypothetical protein